jgi:transposase InsO family protein
MSNNLRTEQTIVLAWNMAIQSNKIIESLVFHSDRGSPYSIQTFTKIIKSYKGIITQSMSRKGNY